MSRRKQDNPQHLVSQADMDADRHTHHLAAEMDWKANNSNDRNGE